MRFQSIVFHMSQAIITTSIGTINCILTKVWDHWDSFGNDVFLSFWFSFYNTQHYFHSNLHCRYHKNFLHLYPFWRTNNKPNKKNTRSISFCNSFLCFCHNKKFLRQKNVESRNWEEERERERGFLRRRRRRKYKLCDHWWHVLTLY